MSRLSLKKAQRVSNRCKDLFKQKKYFVVMDTLRGVKLNYKSVAKEI